MVGGTPLLNQMMDWGGWGWPFMGLWMAGLWILLLLLAIWVYRDAQKRGMNGALWMILVLIPMFGFLAFILYLAVRETPNPASTGGKSAGAILDERYARGEVSRDEYLRMRQDLGAPGEQPK